MFARLSIPTPFQVGAVNAYLAGRTLVDPGPDSDEAWSALLDALEERELAPADIERVLITHPHPDHFGLAARLADEGASVIASEPAAAIMRDFRGRYEQERTFFTDFFERCGMAARTAETVTDIPESFIRYAPDVDTDREVVDDDTLVVQDTRLEVLVTSGHAEGETIFEYTVEDSSRAIVGDHVLAEITPNPLLLPPPAAGGERPRALPTFNRSLDRLRDRNFDRLLTGHRDPVTEPGARIDEILAAHEERTENVLALVDGPTTPVDVMEGLFGDLPVTEYFAGMSEAVGHLDVLEARDEVAAREQGGLLVYEQP